MVGNRVKTKRDSVMKKILLLLIIVGSSLSLRAQMEVYPIVSGGVVEGYSLPRTVVKVSVVQQREVIIRGPYARYASQYLGVTGAPMTDRESYKLLSATLSYSTTADPAAIYAFDQKSKSPLKAFVWADGEQHPIEELPTDGDYLGAQLSGRTPFTDVGTSTVMDNNVGLPINSSGAVEKSEEQMAADAAALIFKIRQRRVELICGEQGENVYGEGLKAALEEMDKIESEYVALFLGKRYVQRSSRVFSVVPQRSMQRVVAFRFSTTGGVVSVEDLLADPISVEFESVDSNTSTDHSTVKGQVVKYRVPQLTKVTLWDGTTVFDTEEMPIYQMGKVVDVPIL